MRPYTVLADGAHLNGLVLNQIKVDSRKPGTISKDFRRTRLTPI